MKHSFLLGMVLLFSSVAFSQINKRQWLIGGSGSLFTTKLTNSGQSTYTAKGSGIILSPNVGYFPVNNLIGGLRTYFGYSHNKGGYNNGYAAYTQTSWQTQVGPFVRYYFLPAQHKMNLLADASYFVGWTHTKENSYNSAYQKHKDRLHGYSFSAGPVWFLNPATALELTLDYSNNYLPSRNTGVYLNVGLQVHLRKGKG